MEVLLINPTTSRDPKTDTTFQLPLGPLTLGTYLKCKIPDIFVQIVDLEFEKRQGCSDALATHLEKQWDLIGVTTHYDNFSESLSIAERVKSTFTDVPLVLGGVHATACHREIVKNYMFIDAVVRGEGEQALCSMVKNFSLGLPFYQRVRSLTYRENGSIVIAPEEDLLELERVPPLDLSLIPLQAYIGHPRFAKRPWVESGRGCRFHCRFCASPLRWRFKTRYFSPEKIAEDLRRLIDAGVREVNFTHDQFLAEPKVVREMCRILKELKNQLQWQCYARVDSLTPEIIGQLADAGCIEVFVGFETIAPQLQRNIAKKYSEQQALDAVKMCIANGVNVSGNFIFNLPEANEEMVERDFTFILELKHLGAGNLQTSYLRLMPGADFFEKRAWHDTQNAIINNESASYMRHTKIEDQRRLFAYLFREEEGDFLGVPILALREIACCLVELFTFTLSYLKNTRGLPIFDIMRACHETNMDLFEVAYTDADLWHRMRTSLQSFSHGDQGFDDLLQYEEAIGALSLGQVDTCSIRVALDVEDYILQRKIAFRDMPQWYRFSWSAQQQLLIEEVEYEEDDKGSGNSCAAA